MSETIWRATDNDGRCWYYGENPDWSEHQFYSQDGRVLEYYGKEKPPPGECWEMTVTRNGDIDTDGDPIGWKIVGIGKDGSVLCEKGNGQRRRYSFGDGAKEQPSGEAWERLVEACREYRDLMKNDKWYLHPYIAKIVAAFEAYEAAQSAEPNEKQKQRFIEACQDDLAKLETAVEVLTKERDEALRELANERSISDQVIDERNATIAELRSELDETRTERHAYKSRLREFCQRLVDMVGAEGPEDVQVMLDKVNAELHRLKQNIDSMSANLADKEGFLNSAGDEIEVLTKERDEAKAELRSLSTHSGHVTTEQINVIAELRAKLERPEMPEVVRSLIGDIIREVPGRFSQAIAAVEAHYDPPFKVDKPGWYLASDGKEWRVAEIDGDTAWGRNGFVSYGFSTKRVASSLLQLTEYLRPLEG